MEHQEEAWALLEACQKTFEDQRRQALPYAQSLENLATRGAVLAASPRVKIAVVYAILHHPRGTWSHMTQLLTQLFRHNLPYTQDDVRAILQASLEIDPPGHIEDFGILDGLAKPLADPEILAACRPELERLRERIIKSPQIYSEIRENLKETLNDILDDQQGSVIVHDEWGTRMIATLAEMEKGVRMLWLALLKHCFEAKGSVPSKKWSERMQKLVEELGMENFRLLAIQWIGAFDKNGSRVDEDNANTLKGLAWGCSLVEDATLASALASAAIEGYRKIPGIGPRSAKIGAACVLALRCMPGLHAAAQLERVRMGVKQPAYHKGIEMALNEAAQRAGLSRTDLEELTVPTFDLDQGKLRVQIGNATAELEIKKTTVQVQWYGSDGNARKSEPAEVKKAHKSELKDLKRLCDDIAKMLGAQRERLERLPLSEREWSLATWRERYIEHPLVGILARRLLWRFSIGEQTVTGIWYDGKLVDVADQPLELPDETVVTAWHPVLSSVSEIREWREWLERHQVVQPFKQAHREVYILTDAERNTRTYSNRFAAHILRQHQLNALAQGRGWRNQLRLMVDDSVPPATLEMPHWRLRAEFWIEAAGNEFGVDTNSSGTYLHVATDQVRFYPIEAVSNIAHASGGGYSPLYRRDQDARRYQDPVPLEEIPPLVFSEVMRDVDLFVGVTSIGNDPTWQDGGPDGRYQDYWHRYSFGELPTSAETRKELLSRLIPRLAIAERCTIDGRFLKVRGDLRAYKIHLGSGNILMEPNDQYLCIVPDRHNNDEAATRGLFFPFEGDNVFSIILSKAFLLAEGTKISDPSITRQINWR